MRSFIASYRQKDVLKKRCFQFYGTQKIIIIKSYTQCLPTQLEHKLVFLIQYIMHFRI